MCVCVCVGGGGGGGSCCVFGQACWSLTVGFILLQCSVVCTVGSISWFFYFLVS